MSQCLLPYIYCHFHNGSHYYIYKNTAASVIYEASKVTIDRLRFSVQLLFYREVYLLSTHLILCLKTSAALSDSLMYIR